MIITAVERKRGPHGRVRIYVDGLPALEVARQTARTRDLRPGRSIAAGEMAAIAEAEARRQAFETAARMLARRPHSEREIRRRLAQRRYAPPLIDETIGRLTEMRAIDDAGFAQSYVEARDRTSPRSARLLGAELRAHGVDADSGRDALASLDDGDAAYRYAERRVRAIACTDYRAFRDRLGNQLRRRGFGWDTVQATVERCWRERNISRDEQGSIIE